MQKVIRVLAYTNDGKRHGLLVLPLVRIIPALQDFHYYPTVQNYTYTYQYAVCKLTGLPGAPFGPGGPFIKAFHVKFIKHIAK